MRICKVHCISYGDTSCPKCNTTTLGQFNVKEFEVAVKPKGEDFFVTLDEKFKSKEEADTFIGIETMQFDFEIDDYVVKEVTQ